ncbi:MAG: energy transducer TonB [Bacteroidota bacterium]
MIKKIIIALLFASPFITWSQQKGHQQDSLSEKASEVFTIVEESATFPGGMNSFYRFLGGNITFPPQALEKGVGGRVFVQFIVEKDGSISNIQVVKGIGAGCDEEAARVIQLMPDWIPAKYNGVPVRQKMVQAITFAVAKRGQGGKQLLEN